MLWGTKSTLILLLCNSLDLVWTLVASPKHPYSAGDQTGPGHSTVSQEKHLPGETNAQGLLYLAKGDVLVHSTDYVKKMYFQPKEMGEWTICESSCSYVDGDSKAVYPQELSPHWRCWVNLPWPLTDPHTACVSAVRRSQPGSSAPKHCPFQTPLQKAAAEVTQESAAHPRPAWATSPFTLLGFHPSSFAFACCHFLWLFNRGTLVAIIHSLVSDQSHSKELQLSINTTLMLI